MVRLSVLACLALASVGTTSESDLDSRACTVASNALKNPGFESGAISPWVYSPTYANLASATVVGPGLYSNKAIQLHANSGPNDPTSASTFSQTINLCKNSLFQLKWSMVQNKGGTTYDSKHPYYPEAYIYVKSPDGLQYPLADFRFSTTNYNYTVFSTSSSTKTGSHPVSQWTNYTADFPKTQVGNWVVQVQWFTAVGSGATANSTFTAKFDDFAVKLK